MRLGKTAPDAPDLPLLVLEVAPAIDDEERFRDRLLEAVGSAA